VSVLSQEQIDAMVKMSQEGGPKKAGDKQRSVFPCNFRSAGLLSNENARSLSAAHETFARYLASTLDAYLGTGLEVKLQAIEQLPSKDHMAAVPPLTYIVPFSLTTIPSTMIMECDIDLVFPIIDLLLGGRGTPGSNNRELSEIEEEIMLDVTALIARLAENTWHMPHMSLVVNRRIKSSLLHQYCPPNEKLTLVKFDIELAGNTGLLQLVFPTAFLNILIKQIKLDQPDKKGGLRYFPAPSIRERILDCDVMIASEITGMKVAVRDLIALQPGCVLKLRAPVRNPGMLTVGGQEIFEALPVRNGSQKAAQLGRRTFLTNWGKD
jgi:flagellar motor switch protein FliM